ncbi:MAG TPA: Crp/Fnr family transcriptional regulator [Solirubrobacteraceae bacterium]|nr:Crp/Fnr family transcriptional regulator [Solirubrobacteraceae bacterium]
MGGSTTPLVAGTFLARLTPEERAAVEALGRPASFPRGSVIMFEGEPEERLILALGGRVKITRAGPDGREIILGIRDPGDLLGELAFIDRRPRSATVVALEPIQAVIMSGSRFREHLEQTPRVAVVLLEVVAGRFREATLNRLQFAALDTMGRLAARILELAERYGENVNGSIEVPLPLSQEELASWTGASRTGVAQALQDLRELGWLETQRGQITVRDPAALRARAGATP